MHFRGPQRAEFRPLSRLLPYPRPRSGIDVVAENLHGTDGPSQLVKWGVAVEKGTKAVISVNFSAYGKRRFNNLRANFVREIPREEFFNTYAYIRQLTRQSDVIAAAGQRPSQPVLEACSRGGRHPRWRSFSRIHKSGAVASP